MVACFFSTPEDLSNQDKINKLAFPPETTDEGKENHLVRVKFTGTIKPLGVRLGRYTNQSVAGRYSVNGK